MRPIGLAAVAIIAVMLLTAESCAETEETGQPIAEQEDTTEPADEETTDEEEQAEPEEPSPAAEPDGTFTSNCDYLLGDFTETRRGYRFVADSRVKNTGNVGIVAQVTATWSQIGARPVRERKEVRVPYGRAKTVRFMRVASPDEIDLHQSSEAECRVNVKITDFYGDVQG